MSGHGLASVIKAVAQNDGIIDRKLWIHKSITSVLIIGTGGGGREAPIVQVGSAIGSTIAQMLRFSPNKTPTLLGCGAAAGLAAVFNAPIGGVMFAVEVLLGDFSVKTFSPIVIAAVIGTVLSRSFLGNSPTFQVPEYALVSNTELLFYCVLGILAGLSAVMFIKVYYSIANVMKTDYVKFIDSESAENMIDVFFNTPESSFLVTNDQGLFSGIISLDEMRALLRADFLTGIIAQDITKKDVPVLYEFSNLDEALKLFEISDYNMLPVLDTDSGKLLGVVRQEEAFAYYRKQLNLYGSDQYESQKS